MVFAVVFYLGLVVGSLLLLGVGLLTIQDGFRRYEERSVIEDRPVSSLDSIAMGKTALVGTARPDDDPVRVPFGGEERALLYDLTVRDTNKVDEPHVDERVGPPFVVETDDGAVRVDAGEFTLDLTADRRWEREIGSHEDIPPDLAAFADRHDLPDQGFDRDREFAYEYLAPGDEVFVYGRAVPDEDRDTTGKAVLVTAHDFEGGFLSNKDVDTLLAERRRSLLRNVSLGVAESVVGLAAFLWLSGIAQAFLGA